MDRRSVLAYGSALAAGLAGCLGRSNEEATGTSTSSTTGSARSSGESTATVTGSTDGYPPPSTDTATEREIDTASFDTVERNGVDVPLAPVEATRYWHQRRDARFADARGPGQYETAHILGAVSSPANNSLSDDPVLAWPKDARIVCYCGCPHHLSSIRAEDLLSNGYENVYVIDEGVREWQDRDYPMAGNEPDNQPAMRVIEGRAAAEFAGETAWASHQPSDQREATGIEPDGSYTLELKFADLTPESPIRVRTPGYTIERPLDALTGTILTE